MENPIQPYLVDVVAVDKAKRIRCQAEGCGHGVYARIHVVLDRGKFVVLGGDCFQRLYGMTLQGTTSYYGGSASSPTQLTEKMRTLLTSNTAEFVEALEHRRQQIEAEAAQSLARQAHQAAQGHAVAQPSADTWTSANSVVSRADMSYTLDGRYRYMWSSSWWKSATTLITDISASAGEQADSLYKAIVAMVRQPTITPETFAIQMENDGVPREVTLQCLRAIHLVVRAKVSP